MKRFVFTAAGQVAVNLFHHHRSKTRRLSFVLDDNTLIEVKAESSTGMMLKGEVLF